jgi:L-galactono-1,4-lactone dehydrogenase
MIFMKELLKGIEDEVGIPAHSPIEQRWSASSSSYMSPAHGPKNGLHSWVGIINYLPSDVTLMDPKRLEQQRHDITASFQGTYCDLVRTIGYKYNATSHWAKLEIPSTISKLIDLRLFLEQRYPIQQFNQLRGMYDPKNILSNPLIDTILGKPTIPTTPDAPPKVKKG